MWVHNSKSLLPKLLRTVLSNDLGIREVGLSGASNRYFERCLSTTYPSHIMPESRCPNGPPAFVFDIDGVLVRGKYILPAARQAVAKLSSSGKWVYPVVFITNGGGVPEGTKAEQLSEWLDIEVEPSQVILAHTPMRSLVPRLGNLPVLVVGCGAQEVASYYGFKRVLTTQQLASVLKTATPSSKHGVPPHEPELCPVTTHGLGTEAAPIAAVLVVNDPEDWYRDAQLICDVISSGGVPSRPGHPPAGSPVVELYFSNADLLWVNEFPRPRFGQGAFATMVTELHSRLTGHAPAHTFFGKPNPQPYRLAERLLIHQARRLRLVPDYLEHDRQASTSAFSSSTSPSTTYLHGVQETGSLHEGALTAPGDLPFSGVYAVGDNPAADVRGANACGPPWVSVLVRTGVFTSSESRSNGTGTDAAHIVVENVADAVEAALHRTRSLQWHSMR